MSFSIPPLRTTSRQPLSNDRPHTHDGHIQPSQPSRTWTQGSNSSSRLSNRRTSSASVKLVGLINKFEDLDAASLDLPPHDLHPTPLQIQRKRPRVEDPNRLSTIVSPDVRNFEDVLPDPFSPTERTAVTTTPSAHTSGLMKFGHSPYKLGDNEAYRLVTPDLPSESRMLRAPSSFSPKDTAGKRAESISFKDRIKLFDKGKIILLFLRYACLH